MKKKRSKPRATLLESSGSAWVVWSSKSMGHICLGSEGTPQLFNAFQRAADFARMLKGPNGPYTVVEVRYRIKAI